MPVIQRPSKPDLYYEVDDFTDPWKNAPFILLQHGFGRSTKFWYRWIPYLARFYKVVRADLRGLGRSGKNFDLADDLHANAYIDDIDAVLDAVGAQDAHYCGESLGGILGMLYAAERPRRVRTLNLVSTPIFLDQDFQNRSCFGYPSWEEALRAMGSLGYAKAKNQGDRFAADTDPGLAQWFAEQQGQSDVEVLIAMHHIAKRITALPALPRLECPVLVLMPSDGPIVTREQEALFREHVRDLAVVKLPSRHHNLHVTQAAACADLVLHFVAQHDGIGCRE
ncbi:alpha/beta fold hydrolase [Candidimonas nitroreducens]|uniref:AB hydrolase-1 domain-containing protein n=1 Tax=Candidimonas nitroreducens TaxID=683354 RepID=A0A225MGR4_9BURK|nr:alpha/beta hydrolase [Candidimonas nitroreducens]OWT60082.1 hypothetical protein CEY11_10420 [Candidimonas nitroreducens]